MSLQSAISLVRLKASLSRWVQRWVRSDRACCWSCVRGIPVARLRVDNLTVFENYFPDLSRARKDPRNGELVLKNAGLYLNFYNHMPDGECETSVISSTSFEISCEPARASERASKCVGCVYIRALRAQGP